MREQEWISLMDEDKLDEIAIANFRKRNYVHFRDEALSCRVRKEEKEQALKYNHTLSRPLRYFVRNLLLGSKELISKVQEEFNKMHREDFFRIVNAMLEEKDKITEETWKTMPPRDQFKLSQVIKWLDRKEVKEFLGLDDVIATKLTGYEKEIFVLRCIANYIIPVVLLRVGVRLLGQDEYFEECDRIPFEELI